MQSIRKLISFQVVYLLLLLSVWKRKATRQKPSAASLFNSYLIGGPCALTDARSAQGDPANVPFTASRSAWPQSTLALKTTLGRPLLTRGLLTR
jgi:hypothetical protein